MAYIKNGKYFDSKNVEISEELYLEYKAKQQARIERREQKRALRDLQKQIKNKIKSEAKEKEFAIKELRNQQLVNIKQMTLEELKQFDQENYANTESKVMELSAE